MNRKKLDIKNEQGSAIVIALMVLSLLTLAGIAATRTSNSEISIAGNETAYNRVLYRTESAVVETAMYIAAALPSDLANRDPEPKAVGCQWMHQEDSPTAPDYTNPSVWDYNNIDNDDNAETLPTNTNIAFAALDKGIPSGASQDMTARTQVRAYRLFGLEKSPEGSTLLEVGFKRRF